MALSTTQQQQKAGWAIDLIKNDSKLPLEIVLDCFEFTWNCPAVQQPDFGRIMIRYTPGPSIAETKALKFYLQQYRYKNAFNEELAERICLDFAYYVRPVRVSIELIQNARGGIANTCTASYQEIRDKDVLARYTPKNNFRGGFQMEKPEAHASKEKARVLPLKPTMPPKPGYSWAINKNATGWLQLKDVQGSTEELVKLGKSKSDQSATQRKTATT